MGIRGNRRRNSLILAIAATTNVVPELVVVIYKSRALLKVTSKVLESFNSDSFC